MRQGSSTTTARERSTPRDGAASAPSSSTLEPPTGDIGLRRKVDRFPFVPDDEDRLALDCYEAYNIQVSGLEQRLRAIATDPAAQDRHRRQRRPRLDPRAHRRGQGDGPARPAAHRHPRASRCPASRRATAPRATPIAPHGVARRHVGGARHPTRPRPRCSRRPGPPLRPRRGGLRRHLRERPGRAAHRLPLPHRQPARRHRARHRRPVRARARLVHLRRRRPDDALRRQRRRARRP